MSSSVESTLGMTFTELQENIARFQGAKFPVKSFDDDEITDVIASGLRQFYFPEAAEGIPEGFKWTFLRTLKEGQVIAADVSTFVLPDDFGGGLTHLNITSSNLPAIQVIEQVQFERQFVGGSTPNGDPKTATVLVSTAAGASESERYSIKWFPQSTSEVTVSYYYDLIPDMIGASSIYPFGAQLHSELILASCFAVVELRVNEGEPGPFQEDFLKRLVAAVARDSSLGSTIGRESIHPITAPALTTFASDYTYLRGQVGNLLGYGFNTQTYTYDESQGIDRTIERGVKNFYYPEMTSGDVVPREWSFLVPTTTIATVADDQDQDLPATVGSIIGDFNYSSSTSFGPVRIVPVSMILLNRSGSSITTGRPTIAATQVKGSDGSAEQTQEVLWWPTPDAAYTFTYQYRVLPNKIDSTNPFTLAGQEHAETILESCLAVAEGGAGPHYDKFLRLLQASVQRDKNKGTADYFGYNGNNNNGSFNRYRTSTVTVDGVQY